MQNTALHKEDSAIAAYRSLQTEILAAVAKASGQLVNSYLDKLFKALCGGL